MLELAELVDQLRAAFQIGQPGIAGGDDFRAAFGEESDEADVVHVDGDFPDGIRHGVGIGLFHERTLGRGGDFLAPLAGEKVAQGVHVEVEVPLHLVRIGTRPLLVSEDVVLEQGHVQVVGALGRVPGIINLDGEFHLAGKCVDGGAGGDVGIGFLRHDVLRPGFPVIGRTAGHCRTSGKHMAVDCSRRIGSYARLAGERVPVIGTEVDAVVAVGVCELARMDVDDEEIADVGIEDFVGGPVPGRAVRTSDARVLFQHGFAVLDRRVHKAFLG